MKPNSSNNLYSSTIKLFETFLISKATLSYFQGFLLGIPYALSNSPLYFFAIFVFFLAAVRNPSTFFKLRTFRKQLIYILFLLAILSNLIGSSSKELDSFRIFSTSFFFLLLFFGGMVENKKELLEGFSGAMVVWSVFMIFLAIYLQIYNYGLQLFFVPEYRLWGVGYVPDWPNYMAFMLAFAFMLNVLVFRRLFSSIILFLAIVITTSRTPFLAIGLILIFYLFYAASISKLKKVILYISLLIAVFLIIAFATNLSPDFIERILVFEDRQRIYSFAFDLLRQSPIWGQGSILLDDSVGFQGFPSFHNTYFDISVRHGLPTLIIFLYILTPSAKNIKLGGVAFILTILFFILGSIFQNFLKHPHIIMLYMVLINSGYIFLNNDKTS